jgi:hypothetical protein
MNAVTTASAINEAITAIMETKVQGSLRKRQIKSGSTIELRVTVDLND